MEIEWCSKDDSVQMCGELLLSPALTFHGMRRMLGQMCEQRLSTGGLGALAAHRHQSGAGSQGGANKSGIEEHLSKC
eukprot:612514-Amphidinium_carterae.2